MNDHRITSLFSFCVFERRIMLDLSALRNGAVVLGTADLALWQAPILGDLAALILAPCNGAFIALLSADWVEHWLKILALGYNFNARVMARGELEGTNAVMDKDQEAMWRTTMYVPIPADDPGSGHYDFPIPTFWGRVKALFGGTP